MDREVEVTGVIAAEEDYDLEELWQTQVARYEKRRAKELRRTKQRIVVGGDGPYCMVHMADLHLGGEGVDYARLDRETDIILGMPSTGVGVLGDLVENFILGKMRAIRDSGSIAIVEEWLLAARWLMKVEPVLKYVVGGNHDKWTFIASGLDHLRGVVSGLGGLVLYDPDQVEFMLQVGGHEWRVRARHKWAGHSQYNDTHGIERGYKFDGAAFDLGIGAHTHVSGLYRGWHAGARQGGSVQCGTYKRYDDYGNQLGVARANQSTAVAVIFNPERGTMTGYENLEDAAEYMHMKAKP